MPRDEMPLDEPRPCVVYMTLCWNGEASCEKDAVHLARRHGVVEDWDVAWHFTGASLRSSAPPPAPEVNTTADRHPGPRLQGKDPGGKRET